MAYVSLYRKYRPQTFAEVVGQDHVTRTLAQAVDEARAHHAYLFTGPRGTGKTSTARILAKALNCVQGPTSTPCNVCDHCVAITGGSSIDVIEIDAASHGGVDDVRDLRDRVAFAPASARTKVYIVDECHMLSTAGWNAFLKTVEEPPGHVVFVFATTEPHKVLATILSRTQRFDFKRVGADTLASLVADLGRQEDLEFEPGAVELVVRAGDGSVRDTLSVLDQVIAYSGGSVTVQAVAEVLGATPDDLLTEAAGLLAAHDAGGCCVLVQRLADAGHDPRQFARDLVEHLRALFLIQVAPDAGLVETTPERLGKLRDEAGRLGRTELVRAMDLLAEAQAQMRRGNTRLPLELALVKAALPEFSADPAALAARVERLERGGPPTAEPIGVAPLAEPAPAEPAPAEQPAAPVESGPPPAPPPAPPPDPPPDPPQEPSATPSAAPAAEAPAAAGPGPAPSTSAGPSLADVVARWDDVMAAVKTAKIRFHAMLAMGRPVDLTGGVLTLEFRAGYGLHAEQCASPIGQEVIGRAIAGVVGAPLRVVCVVADGAVPGPVESPGGVGGDLEEQAVAVAETEAAAAAGELPDDEEAHAVAIQTLGRELGARVVDEGDSAPGR